MKKLLALIVFIFCSVSAFPQTATNNGSNGGAEATSRPKVGLVLAGGGAKGAAHIGAIKYIEELGIPIDYIAGTSMGSIIGGLYALGYSPDEMNELIKNVDWTNIIGNATPRSGESLEVKNKEDKYLVSIPFGISEINKQLDEIYREDKDRSVLSAKGEVINNESNSAFFNSLPSGIISGNNVENLFNDLSIGYQDSIDFMDLPIPFACVTTNMLDGSETVLKSGKIAYAMRSSMAIPIVFAPAEYNNMLLVDGGMVNNFPTDVCREMGADIIIGVELTKGFKVDMTQVESMPGMLSQLMAIVTSGRNAENRKLCDAYIRPDVSGYGTMSFDSESIDSLVERGYDEARQCTEGLLAIREMLGLDGPLEKKLRAPRAYSLNSVDSIYVSRVNFNGVSEDEAGWMNRKWSLKDSEPYSADDIRKLISKFMGTGCYEKLSYNLVPDDDGSGKYHLDLYFTEYEPHLLSLGLRGDTEEAVVIGFDAGFNVNKLSGLSASLSGKLSYYPFIQAKASYAWQGIARINLYYDFWKSKYHSLIDDFYITRTYGKSFRNRFRLSVSEFHARFIHAEGGLEYKNYNYDSSLASIDSVNRSAGLFLNFVVDKRDDSYYAEKGVKFTLNAGYNFFSETLVPIGNKVGSVNCKNGDIYGSVEMFFTPADGPVTIIPQLYHRTFIGNYTNISQTNCIGGSLAGRYSDHQLPFFGLNEIYPSKYNNVSIARCDVRVRILKKHYVTGIFNYLEAADDFSDYFNRSTPSNTIVPESVGALGAALKYTYASKIGPLSLDVHWSDYTREVGLYLSLGYDF